jgi:hypothetical protein
MQALSQLYVIRPFFLRSVPGKKSEKCKNLDAKGA